MFNIRSSKRKNCKSLNLDDTGQNWNDDYHNKIHDWPKTNECMALVLPIPNPTRLSVHGSCFRYTFIPIRRLVKVEHYLT